MRAISLYDTRERRVRPLQPRDEGKVGIYACGPTVYSRVHVGNARPFVVFTQLKRFLEHEGYDVTFVGNVTDINDKIYDAARAAGRDSAGLAREMTAHYVEDTDRLGLGRPDHEPLASEYVGPIVELIEALVQNGHAYAADGDVYFRVRSLPSYGELSRRDVEQMDQGEGVEGADRKEDPLDFALWKAQKEDEDTAWDSPWGRGRPGWHIECSAMAEQLLGVGLDIHGGGIDLVFPHHENEIAQSRCAFHTPVMANTWMHNGFLQVEGEKMAKSLGNFFTIRELLADWPGEVLRFQMLMTHYHQPIDWTKSGTEQAAVALDTFHHLTSAADPRSGRVSASVLAALADDLNTPLAIADLHKLAAEARRGDAQAAGDLLATCHFLGLDLSRMSLQDILRRQRGGVDENKIDALIDARNAARKAKNFKEADRIRDELKAMDIELEDHKDDTTTWKVKR
jgi:cysteinyl-tRNA synthetase